jgi:hypothetical protein
MAADDGIGFIDGRNVDICEDMFNDIGVPYQKTGFGWGFKFTNPTQELIKDIAQYLRIDNSKAKPWPVNEHELHRKFAKTNTKSYYDLITLDDNNKQVIREYIKQRNISTIGSPRGLQGIVIFAVDLQKLDFIFFRHCCESIMQATKGQYKTAITKALNDYRSGNYPQYYPEKITKTTIIQTNQTVLRAAVLKHVDLTLENYPPPLFPIEGMGTKSLQKRSPNARALRGLLGF